MKGIVTVRQIGMFAGHPIPYSAEFETFWAAYPNKTKKTDAWRAWREVNGPAHLPAILTALGWQKRQGQWTRDRGEFVPLASSYLRARRWDDECPPHLRFDPTPRLVHGGVDDDYIAEVRRVRARRAELAAQGLAPADITARLDAEADQRKEQQA